MRDERLRQYKTLIDAVSDGTTSIADAVYFQPTLEDDGYCVYNVHAEFQMAFGKEPRCAAALPLIRSLTAKLLTYAEDDTMLLFNETEWKQLVTLRGPVEGVEWFGCVSCAYTTPAFVMSGFLDVRPATCGACGSVLFQSTYDDRPLPSCSCGGAYAWHSTICPRCARGLVKIDQVWGYQYFASHAWANRSNND